MAIISEFEYDNVIHPAAYTRVRAARYRSLNGSLVTVEVRIWHDSDDYDNDVSPLGDFNVEVNTQDLELTECNPIARAQEALFALESPWSGGYIV